MLDVHIDSVCAFLFRTPSKYSVQQFNRICNIHVFIIIVINEMFLKALLNRVITEYKEKWSDSIASKEK